MKDLLILLAVGISLVALLLVPAPADACDYGQQNLVLGLNTGHCSANLVAPLVSGYQSQAVVQQQAQAYVAPQVQAVILPQVAYAQPLVQRQVVVGHQHHAQRIVQRQVVVREKVVQPQKIIVQRQVIRRGLFNRRHN